ncbi:MAG: hypothetical protein R3A49_11435 [Acidimicrobiia bacterium]
MRLIIWNMHHWRQPADTRPKAWEWLKQNADVALVQEASPPDELRSESFQPIHDTQDWGSGVIGFGIEVEVIAQARGRANKRDSDLLQTWPGSVAVGRVDVGGRRITLVSAYGVIDNGYAVTTVNRILTDLVPLFDEPSLGKYVILGGDLNITTQWTGSDERYLPWHRAAFQRIEAFGLRDCLDAFRADCPLEGCGCTDGDVCRHIHTHVHQGSDRPWQDDYVFASEPLFNENVLTHAEVLDTPELRDLSDHLPVAVGLTQ